MSALLIIFLLLLPIFLLLTRRRSSPKRLPPCNLGIPVIGQSLAFLHALRANTAEQWLEKRAIKYGPISKLTLFGKPTIFIHGQAANKLVFTSDSSTMSNQQTEAITVILGDRSLLNLSGQDHKRVRDALVSFLKPESLKKYVGKIDGEIRQHIELHWQGKEHVTVLPQMKTLTFNIICSFLFGLERGARRDRFVDGFQEMIQGMWAVPVNLPFTSYYCALKASAKVQDMVKDLIREKRIKLDQKLAAPCDDLITCLLSIRDGNNEAVISENEIVHNVMLVMAAGHDTSSILITFLIRLLANDCCLCSRTPSLFIWFAEQEEIAKGKQRGDSLTWEDLAKMKYTWRVAMETLRMVPPIFGGFRKALKDIEYGGYVIPAGWQIFWVASMTHMDDRIFPEPSKFDPSRYENQTSIPPYCYVPFGAGPRICPGYEFSRIETLVAIHYLVTHFTWKLLCPDNFFSRNPTPVPTKGLPIQIMQKSIL